MFQILNDQLQLAKTNKYSANLLDSSSTGRRAKSVIRVILKYMINEKNGKSTLRLWVMNHISHPQVVVLESQMTTELFGAWFRADDRDLLNLLFQLSIQVYPSCCHIRVGEFKMLIGCAPIDGWDRGASFIFIQSGNISITISFWVLRPTVSKRICFEISMNKLFEEFQFGQSVLKRFSFESNDRQIRWTKIKGRPPNRENKILHRMSSQFIFQDVYTTNEKTNRWLHR